MCNNVFHWHITCLCILFFTVLENYSKVALIVHGSTSADEIVLVSLHVDLRFLELLSLLGCLHDKLAEHLLLLHVHVFPLKVTLVKVYYFWGLLQDKVLSRGLRRDLLVPKPLNPAFKLEAVLVFADGRRGLTHPRARHRSRRWQERHHWKLTFLQVDHPTGELLFFGVELERV